MHSDKKIIIGRYIYVISLLTSTIVFWFVGYKMGKIGYGNATNQPQVEQIEAPNIKVMHDDLEVLKDTSLDIFKNKEFNDEAKIAPGSKGEYKFSISNLTKNDIAYDISFSDVMQHKVNMMYRLRIDNIYIKGSENKYVNINELNVKDIKVLENSTNLYTLEWYWEDSDKNDTIVGSQKDTQYYTLNLSVNAKKITSNK